MAFVMVGSLCHGELTWWTVTRVADASKGRSPHVSWYKTPKKEVLASGGRYLLLTTE